MDPIPSTSHPYEQTPQPTPTMPIHNIQNCHVDPRNSTAHTSKPSPSTYNPTQVTSIVDQIKSFLPNQDIHCASPLNSLEAIANPVGSQISPLLSQISPLLSTENDAAQIPSSHNTHDIPSSPPKSDSPNISSLPITSISSSQTKIHTTLLNLEDSQHSSHSFIALHHHNCPYPSIHLHHTPPPPYHLIHPLPFTMQNPHLPLQYRLIYTSSAPQPLAPAQSWLEMGLLGHAQTFALEINNQDILIMIQNSMDIAQIVTERMRLGWETYAQYQSFIHQPLMFNPYNLISPPFNIPHYQPYGQFT